MNTSPLSKAFYNRKERMNQIAKDREKLQEAIETARRYGAFDLIAEIDKLDLNLSKAYSSSLKLQIKELKTSEVVGA